MKIEGFRNLNSDLEKIINQSEKINKLKKESSEKDLTPKEKKNSLKKRRTKEFKEKFKRNSKNLPQEFLCLCI